MKRKILYVAVLPLLLWLNSSAQEPPPALPEPIPSPPTGAWIQKASFADSRYGMFSFTIGDKGYAGTGADYSGVLHNDFWEYNPTTNAWTQKADYAGGIRYYATSFSVNGRGYTGTGAAGSYQWRKDMWEYDPATNSWNAIADFAGGYRYTMVGFGIGNKGYVGTGNYRENPWVLATYYNDFWEYDPATDVWTRKADVPELGRTNAIGVAIGDKGYVGFGMYYYDTRKSDWWQYDPATDVWTRKAGLPSTPRFDPDAFTIGSKAFICSGWYYSALNDMWEYDANADSWTERTYTPLAARGKGITFSIGNKGYLGTGYDNTGNPISDFWEYFEVTPPAFTSCPSNQTIYTTAQSCQNVVDYVAIATGVPTPDILYSFTGATVNSGTGTGWGQTLNLGITAVTITATNIGGTATCTFNVEVLDATPPQINCPPTQNICYKPDNSYTIPQLTATDNCGIQTVQYAITGATVRSGTGVDASGSFNPGTSNIKWRVTDNSGNVGECTTVVIVKPKFTVSIPDTYPLLIWGRVNTLFIGFGTTCAPMIAIPSGGTPFPGLNAYRYAWSNGSTSIATLACLPPVPGSYTFTVTVTDAAGCTATTSKTIQVVDARCGPRNNEVMVCWFGSQSCYKTWQAVIALYYGAQIGPCNAYAATGAQKQNNAKEFLVSPGNKITVYPNPSGQYFNLSAQSLKAEQLQIKIFDAFGREIEQLKGSANKTYTFGHQYKQGIYLVEVQQGIEKYTFKVIKL
jgi:hypothetical protein